MTLGDLLSGLKSKVGSMFDGSDAQQVSNLPALQSQYQMYAADSMSRGQTPLTFQQWLAVRQQQQ